MSAQEGPVVARSAEPRIPCAADTIDGEYAPRVRAGLAGIDVEGSRVLLDEHTGRTHLLNPTATTLWSCFDGSVTIDALAAELAELYSAEFELVRSDVLHAARGMAEQGLLEGIVPAPIHAPREDGADGLEVGTPAPAFAVADLDGTIHTLDEFLGSPTVLVNWGPSCGFCDRVAPDVLAAHAALAEHGVQLVVVGVGTPAAMREVVARHGFSCTVLAAPAGIELFAGLGTPAAYLLDAGGAVAARLALGSNRVPVLLRVAAGEAVEGPDEASRRR